MSAPDRAPSPARPLRVALVGSGPSGFYAAEALLKAPAVECDVFDRLPMPYGLVRGGVAPDHQNIKKVVAMYERVAGMPGFRFFGNVKIGRDLMAEDLYELYDVVIYAVGNEGERQLGLPGESLPGVHSATEFVFWYNGHPDYAHYEFETDVENVAVIGVGNVAMDVARILAKAPDELAGTDISEAALAQLRASTKIKRIYVLGRRGPAQSAFTPKEIKELGTLLNADLIVDPNDLSTDGPSGELVRHTIDVNAVHNLKYLLEKAQEAPQGKPRQIILRFLASPIEFAAGDDGRLAWIQVERNFLESDTGGTPRARGTGRLERLKVGLALKAVGYRGIPIPGVPFSEKKGLIPNIEGRVVEADGSTVTVPGAYVVGWAKRGPSGLIGTNKGDSMATVAQVLKDYAPGQAGPHRAAKPDARAVIERLEEKNIRYVSFDDWKKIDAVELERGRQKHKIRDKFINKDDALDVLEDGAEQQP